MNEEEFSKLIKKDKYQVFIFSSPVPFPLNFAVHCWVVINLKGKINRWEFGKFRLKNKKTVIGVLKNAFNPTKGMNLYFWKSEPRLKSKLIGHIEGNNRSVAKEMANFIESSSKKYPLRKIYSIAGNNSNTFVQWTIDKFPDSGFRLPFNAFGKGHKI